MKRGVVLVKEGKPCFAKWIQPRNTETNPNAVMKKMKKSQYCEGRSIGDAEEANTYPTNRNKDQRVVQDVSMARD